MNLAALILENLDTLMALACAFFIFYGAALFVDRKLPAKGESTEPRRRGRPEYFYD